MSKNNLMLACADCGMVMETPDEYHPYAACLMYKQCKDEEVVRKNLFAVIARGYRYGLEEANKKP